MNTARDDILGGIRRALRRGPVSSETGAELQQRVAAHRRNLVPARATALGHRSRVPPEVLYSQPGARMALGRYRGLCAPGEQ